MNIISEFLKLVFYQFQLFVIWVQSSMYASTIAWMFTVFVPVITFILFLYNKIYKKRRFNDSDSKLRDYLSKVLENERDNHPSFQLLKADEIDSLLYPQIEEYPQIEPIGNTKKDRSKNDEKCAVWTIIKDSWSAKEHRNVVILGNGGIGKTVTLFSITKIPSKYFSVPTLYIPMYELVDEDERVQKLGNYIKDKYEEYGDQINYLATKDWKKQPRLVLLLDGFNEVPFSLRRQVLYVVNAWYGTHPGVQLIAVSRPVDGLDLEKELSGNPIPLTLSLLEETSVKMYLEKAGANVPPQESPIWEIIRFPLFLNLYIKSNELVGKTASGYPLLVMKPVSGGALIWNFLQRELLRHKSDKNKKAESWVLRCAVANEYFLPYIAYRMMSTQRIDVSYKQVEKWIGEALNLFDKHTLPGHLKNICEEYERLHGRFPDYNLLLFDERHSCCEESDRKECIEWQDTENDILNKWCNFLLLDTCILLPSLGIRNRNINSTTNKNFVFIHQDFRDCLAGLYLVNQADSMTDLELPAVWTHRQSQCALDYAASLMDGFYGKYKEIHLADKLWEANRLNQQYELTTYEKNHIVTGTLLELHKRRKPLPERIDFSGMDLCDFSLPNYLRFGETRLHLFKTSNLACDTKLNRASFQFKGHEGSIKSISFFSDGRVISGSTDDTLRIWDSVTGQCLQTLEGHKGMIKCTAVLPNGQVVSGSSDGTLRVWDSFTGQCLQTLEGHKETVICVAALADGRVISGSKNFLCVWEPSTGQCLQKKMYGTSCIVVFSDGRVVIGSPDGNLYVFNISTDQRLQTLRGHKDRVICIAALPNGRVVSGSYDKTLRVWDLSTGQCLNTLEGHQFSVDCVAALPNGHVISSSLDLTLRVWDPSTGLCLRIISEVRSFIRCFAVLPDGHVVSGSSDGIPRVWDPITGQCLQQFRGHKSPVHAITVLPEGYVVSGSTDGAMYMWNPVTGHCQQAFKGKKGVISCMAVLPDRRVVSGLDDSSLRVWDFSIGKCLQILEGHKGGVSCVAVLPDGRVVSGSDDGSLRVWNLSTGRCEQILEGHKGRVSCVAVLPDRRVVSRSSYGFLYVWDLKTGKSIEIFNMLSTNWNQHLGVLPNGHIVCETGFANMCEIDIEARKYVKMFYNDNMKSITCITVLSDGRVISGTDDNTIRVWDSSTGQCVQSLKGHKERVNSISVLPNECIVSGSDDNTIRVWNLLSGECIQILGGDNESISHVAVLPDSRVINCSNGNILRVWNLKTGECIGSLESTEIDVTEMDFTRSFLTDDLAMLLWKNGAKVFPNCG